MVKKIILPLFLFIIAGLIVQLKTSFAPKKVTFSKAMLSLNYVHEAISFHEESTLIARYIPIDAQRTKLSLKEPIKLSGFDLSDLNLKPVDLSTLYKKIKFPNEELERNFADMRKMKEDLFSNKKLSMIYLADSEEGRNYSLKGKPFSKYLSLGTPGLQSKKIKKKVLRSDVPKIVPRIRQKSIKADLKQEVKSSSALNSQKLLSAIQSINKKVSNYKFNKKMNTQKEAVVVDMSKGPSKLSKKSTTDYFDLALKKGSDCVQTHKLKSKSKNYKSTLRVAADSFSINKGFKTDIHDFNLDFSDSYNNIHYSDKGLIVFEQMLANKMSIRRGTIYKSFHYPTVTDFTFEGDDLTINIPLLEMDSIGRLLKRYQNIQYDSYVLIELDDRTEKVELRGAGSNQAIKLYLNSFLKIVKPGNSDFAYVLYLNVKPGNYFLDYHLSKKRITNKIIHVESEKVYFDSNFYLNESKDHFAIYENDLLTKCAYEVDLESERLINISNQKKASKLNTNNYRFKKMLYPLGTRKYYEMAYENLKLYFGRLGQKQVTIPSRDYVSYLLDQFDIDSLENMCIVQLNLKKKAEDVLINVVSPNYGFDYDMLVLDQDGLFYQDFTANANRVFILGKEQGVINSKIEYVDGSVDYIQSYCSDDTYLVEEL